MAQQGCRIDWNLILDFTDALVWPAVTLVIVMVLRQPIIGLLSKISSVNFRGLDVKFGMGLDQAEAVVVSEEILETPTEEILESAGHCPRGMNDAHQRSRR